MGNYEILGKAAPTLKNEQILTGRANYIDDYERPGMLVGRILYSPHACAKIIKIDTSKAQEIPGVVSVLTHKDVPGENTYLYAEPDQPVFAVDRVNYVGDAIVALAAETEEAADAAIKAIEVDFEILDGLHDPVAALEPNAPVALPGYKNVVNKAEFKLGDLEAGFVEADVIVENTYLTQLIEHAHIETEGALAYVDDDDTVVVIASNQTPHRDRSQVARSLGIPENQVRIITPYVGGAFGSKDEVHVQIHAALLTVKTGRPIKMIRTREESMQVHVKRHPIITHYKSGATKDGKLTAIQVKMIGDTGPYGNAGPHVMGFGASVSSGPYFVPNALIESYTVRTNNLISGAMRGFGAPQGCVAYEAQMDELAKELGIDPLEIRLKNAIQSGQVVPAGGLIREAAAAKASMQEAADMIDWQSRAQQEKEPAPHLRRGWGIGSTWFVIGLGRGKDNSVAIVEMAPDGSVVLRTGAVEMGQGVFSTLVNMAAETLGITTDKVRVLGPDTDNTPDAGPSVASRQTFVSGNAVLRAAGVVRQSLLETAADETGLEVELLDLRGGFLYAEDERLSVTVEELASKASWANKQLSATGFYAMEFPEEFSGKDSYFGVGPSSFGTTIAQVLVDIETGEVKIERMVMVHNVGKIINYGGAYGQMTGAGAMGAGYALMEELIQEEGILKSDSLESFLIPTSLDVPPFEVKLLEIPEPYGPYGAVGLGEPSLTPVAPAIVNAITDAIGKPVKQLPITAERVLMAIEQ